MKTRKRKWDNFAGDAYCFYREPNAPVEVVPPGVYTFGSHMLYGTYVSKTSIVCDTSYDLERDIEMGIMQEIEDFWDRRDKYKEFGLVHKRGILCHGTPGCGKTTLLNRIARRAVSRGVYVFKNSCHDLHLIKTGIGFFASMQPNSPMVVMLEDIDEIADDIDLAEMLDGGSQVDNVVFLGTTNYLNRIPERIRNRPSRFDCVVELGPPEPAVRKKFFELVSQGKVDITTEWIEKTEGLTFAHLKEFFIAVHILGYSIDKAVDKLRGLDMSNEEE